MRTFVFLFVSIFSLSAFASPPRFISMGTEFNQFLKDGANADFESRLQLWQAQIESKFPDLYLHLIANDDASLMESKRRQSATRSFPFLFSHGTEIQEQFRIFETQGRAIIDKLVQQYPEADLSNVTVIGMPSMERFNGQVVTVSGHVYALFGMDMIARIQSDPKFVPGAELVNNTVIVMAHEFTHALHESLSDFGNDEPDLFHQFLTPLWMEGLAQVNSQLLAPGTSLDDVYSERVLARTCTQANIAAWSEIYLTDAKGTPEQIVAGYVKWFTMNPSGLQANGTYRAGYCLGYNIVLSALQKHSMSALLKMPRSEVYPILLQALDDFAKRR